ncbi:MAG: hypothetical protein M0T80_09100, partial [Actinomycetota bacterium]|nr:hypothetical protein [Actinomycetota bacterium]
MGTEGTMGTGGITRADDSLTFFERHRGRSSIEMAWNDDLGIWEGDVGLLDADPQDPAVGPAGPGGVCVLQSTDMSVSVCLTGRVVSAWVGAVSEPDESGSPRLVDDFVRPGSLESVRRPGRARAEPSERPVLSVVPVPERRAGCTEAVLLADTLAHGDLDADPPARLLALAELAAHLAN